MAKRVPLSSPSVPLVVREWHREAIRPEGRGGSRIHPDEVAELRRKLGARASRLPVEPLEVQGRDTYRRREVRSVAGTEVGFVGKSCIDHAQLVEAELRRAQARAPFLALRGLDQATVTITRTEAKLPSPGTALPAPGAAIPAAERFELALPDGSRVLVDHRHDTLPVAPGAKPYVQSRLMVTATDARGHYRRLDFESLSEVARRVREVAAKRGPDQGLAVLANVELLSAHQQSPVAQGECDPAAFLAVQNRYAGKPSAILFDEEVPRAELDVALAAVKATPGAVPKSMTDALAEAAEKAGVGDGQAVVAEVLGQKDAAQRAEKAQLRMLQLREKLAEAGSVAEVEELHLELRGLRDGAPIGSVRALSLQDCFQLAFDGATSILREDLEAEGERPSRPREVVEAFGRAAGLSTQAIAAAVNRHDAALARLAASQQKKR